MDHLPIRNWREIGEGWVIDGDDGLFAFGCLGPASLLALGKVALLAVLFYAISSMLGLWGD